MKHKPSVQEAGQSSLYKFILGLIIFHGVALLDKYFYFQRLKGDIGNLMEFCKIS